jgi:pimeloyl-ACP methyl ester carboxylesterase
VHDASARAATVAAAVAARFTSTVLEAPAVDPVDPSLAVLALDDAIASAGLTNVPVVGIGAAAPLVAELAATVRARVAKLAVIGTVDTPRVRARRGRIVAPMLELDDLDGADAEDLAARVEAHVLGSAPGANDGLLIRHIDDLPWHEVRVMLVDGKRSVVKNRFVDFGERRTICHTWYDPGIALARHSHYAEELIYVLQGGFWIDDVWCPEGTVVVLEPGTYFGPLIAGPEGAYLLEAFPGIGVRAGQDRTGWEERARELGVEPLPDPPFVPPVTT